MIQSEIVKAYRYSIYETFTTEKRDEIPFEEAYFLKADGKFFMLGTLPEGDWIVHEYRPGDPDDE